MKTVTIFSLGILLFLSACNEQKEPKTEDATSPKKENTIKEEPIAKAKESVDSLPATGPEKVVATKKIGDFSADVLSARVVGAILSVDVRVNVPTKKYLILRPALKDIFLIDDATAKKSGLLKDDAGKYLASPTNSEGDNIDIHGYDLAYALNFKFPAPSADAKTVSVTIPSLGGFDGLPITR